MSSTDTKPSTGAPTAEVPVITRQPLHWWTGFVIVGVALIIGVLGGVVSHALYPTHDGKPGAVGKQGPPGEAGRAGPAGPTGPGGSSTDLSTTGYCMNVSYTTDTYSNYTYVSGVSLSSPTLVNGTQTCPSGSFVPLQPTAQNTGTGA